MRELREPKNRYNSFVLCNILVFKVWGRGTPLKIFLPSNSHSMQSNLAKADEDQEGDDNKNSLGSERCLFQIRKKLKTLQIERRRKGQRGRTRKRKKRPIKKLGNKIHILFFIPLCLQTALKDKK
jgi:hypothetical protein